MDPTPKQRALRAALARADAVIAELRKQGREVDVPSARQVMVKMFLSEEQEKLGIKPEAATPNAFGRGLAHGLSDAGTATIAGLGGVQRGLGLGSGLADFAKTSQQEAQDYYNAEGDESGAARMGGRMLGEGALAMATGAGLSKIPAVAASRYGQFVAKGLQPGTGFGRAVAANVAGGLPFDALIGAGRAELDPNLSVPSAIAQEIGYDIAGTSALQGIARGARALFRGKTPPPPRGEFIPEPQVGPTPSTATERAISETGTPTAFNRYQTALEETGFADPNMAEMARRGNTETVPVYTPPQPRQPVDVRELRATDPDAAPFKLRTEAMGATGFADPVLAAMSKAGRAAAPDASFVARPRVPGDFDPSRPFPLAPENTRAINVEQTLARRRAVEASEYVIPREEPPASGVRAAPEPVDMPSTKPGPVKTETGESPLSSTGSQPRRRTGSAAAVGTGLPGEPPKAASAAPSPKTIKPTPKAVAPEGPQPLPNEVKFDPDNPAHMEAAHAVDAKGNKTHILRRGENDELFIAPVQGSRPLSSKTGGGPAEVPPFEPLAAKRRGTPSKQAASTSKPSSGDAESSNPNPSPMEEVRQNPLSFRERLASAEAARLPSRKVTKINLKRPQTLGTPETPKPLQSPSDAAPSPNPNSLAQQPMVHAMGLPKKQGLAEVDLTQRPNAVDTNSLALSVRAERARANPVQTPRVNPYASADKAIESLHQDSVKHTAPLERLKTWYARKKSALRDAFVTSQRLKGSDVIGPDGETRTQFYQLNIDLRRQYAGLLRAALNETVSDLTNATAALRDFHEMQIVSRKYLVEHDLEELARGQQIPRGISKESLLAERARLDNIIAQQPHLAEAVENLASIARAFATDLHARGLLPEEALGKRFYFHNEILDFMRKYSLASSPRGAGISMRLPRSLSKKVGSLRDYDRDFIGVMADYLTSQREMMLRHDLVRQSVLNADFRLRPKAEVAHLQASWDGETPPPGYVFYDTRAGFYDMRGTSLEERVAERLAIKTSLELADHMGLPLHDVLSNLPHIDVPGQPLYKDIAVIPTELAEELAILASKESKMEFLRDMEGLFGSTFKWAALNLNPVRRISRDFFGDTERWVAQAGLDAVDFSNPEIRRIWSDTWTEVKELYLHNNILPNMRRWQDLLVTNSGRIVTEIGDVKRLSDLRRLQADGDGAIGAAESVLGAFKWVGNQVPKMASFREDLLRTFIANLNYSRMLNDLPPITGIVDPAEVKALIAQVEQINKLVGGNEDPIARAAALIARNSLIDYGDFTPFENTLRRSIIPFYAWAKGNTNFWGRQLPKALAREGKGALGVTAAVGSKALRGAATVAAMMASIRMWNSFVMGDAEDRIPTYLRNQNHIILPDFDHWRQTGEFIPSYTEDEYGNRKVATFAPSDAADDFFRMVGLDGAAPEFISYLKGDIDAADLGHYVKNNMLYSSDSKTHLPLPSLARTVLSSYGPVFTLPAAMLGVAAFPDPLNAKSVPEEERLQLLLNAAAVAGAPGVGAALEMTDASMAPMQSSVLNPAKSLGYREAPVNREPTRIASLQREILADIKDLKEFSLRMAATKAGASARSLGDEERDSRVAQMDRVRQTKYERAKRKIEILQKLQRYQETKAR